MPETIYGMEQTSSNEAMMAQQQAELQQLEAQNLAAAQSLQGMSEHKRKFMEEVQVCKEYFRKIPSFEKYNKMIVALKLKNDMDSGRLAIDSKGLGKQLDAMGIDRSRFYDWNKKLLYMDWTYGHAVVERKENKQDMEKMEHLRRFVHADELFEIIEAQHLESHKKSKKHNGIKRTFEGCMERFCNVTRTACSIYCAHCEHCLSWGKTRVPRPAPVPRPKNPQAAQKTRGTGTKRGRKNADAADGVAGAKGSKKRRQAIDASGFPLMAGDVVGSGVPGSGMVPDMSGNVLMMPAGMTADGAGYGAAGGNMGGGMGMGMAGGPGGASDAGRMLGSSAMAAGGSAAMSMSSAGGGNAGVGAGMSMDTARIAAKMASAAAGADSSDDEA